MLNLFKRIRNIWRIGGYDVPKNKETFPIKEIIPEKPKMAQIIRREDVIKKVLNEK